MLADPNIGRTIAGRYDLRERLGTGSLGVVYRAEQRGLGRKLAIKLLAPDATRDPATVERFRREGELLCKLRSPHTVTTYEFDREPDGSLYIAMELSPGRSLAEVLATGGALPWPRVLRILLGLCDSLAEAHALGIVHRDLKPENILLEARPSNPDFVKVLDFGLAKVLTSDVALSKPGQAIGAIEYSSPEALLLRPLDGRSDIYALGVLAHLLVTGEHPFAAARSFGQLITAHVEHVPMSRIELPPDVDGIIARCLEKDPARRFPDVTMLASVTRVVLNGAQLEPNDTLRDPPAL